MATIEERLTALERELTVLEQENAALKKSDELQTIALRALATKDEFTKLRETNNAIFDALINHDQLTNERLGDLQTQVIELDGKMMGLQVETRQGFKDTQNQLVELGGKIVGMQTETRQGFKNVEARLEMVATKDDLSLVSARFDIQDKKFDHMLAMLTALTPKPE